MQSKIDILAFLMFFYLKKWTIDVSIFDEVHSVIDKHFSRDYQLIRYREFKNYLETSMKEAGISKLNFDEIIEILNLRGKFKPSVNFNYPFPQALIFILTAILTSLATQKEIINSS